MKCPKCKADNPEKAKYCIDCGKPMEFLCPECGATTPAKGKFCMECGYKLTSEPAPKTISLDGKLEKLQRYLPKGLTEKILAQRDRIEGERKQLTVMFCDLVGFTPMVEKLGPEEAYGVIDQLYEILIHKVRDYEGTVNDMAGDGIMALFGAPIALEDAPQRAIRSAMAIHREMAKFSDRIRQKNEGLPPLRMRIGIHTGPVVLGTRGNDLRVEFKAVGDTVNLASRMEGLAEPGTTCLTDETFKLTEGLFRFEALGEKKVKGKATPVRIYRVIAPGTRKTRFDVSAERGLTPLVGRERELEILLDGFERCKGGRGQAISIVSEAGVGKSRLLYEFRKAVANEDLTHLEGKCLSYSRGVAYHPHIDILKSNFDIQEGDGDLKIREKVEAGLELLGASETSTMPYILELLSVKDSGIDKIPMSPEARKHRIIDALRRTVQLGSEIRPLILAIEDLHWIDKSSEEVVKEVLDNISGARVFLIFTYRPDFVPTWGGRSYHSQVNLNRLSNRETLVMVAHLLGAQEIDGELENLILEKTEGVPFFIEEFVRSLRDLKIIERKNDTFHLAKNAQGMSIPSTIHDVIMAKVDLLPEDARELVQTASAIEREFSFELLKEVTSLPEQQLLSLLSVLKDSELLYERGIYPRSDYVFKHALTQAVVYDSILTKRKKRLHEKIGKSIETVYKENIDQHYGVLTQHYLTCENHVKAAEYYRLAGKKAVKMALLDVAIANANKRVESLEKLDKTDDVVKNIIDARSALGLYNTQIGYIKEAKEAIAPIIDVTLEHGDKRRLSQIYTILGQYSYMIEEDFPKAYRHLGEGLQLSEEISDVISEVLANYNLGLAFSFDCQFDKALYHIEKALRINEAVNNLWGIAVMKSFLSLRCNWGGQIDLGYQHSKDALQLAEESGDIFSKITAYSLHGFSNYYKGFFGDAIQQLKMATNLGKRIDYILTNAVSGFYLGEALCEIGEYQEAEPYYEGAIRFLENNIWLPSLLNFQKIAFSRAKTRNDEMDVNIESLREMATNNKLRRFEGRMQRYIGEILLHIDKKRISESEHCVRKAIEADGTNGVNFELGRDHVFYGDLLNRKGDQSRAKDNLHKAIEIFKKCGADGWVTRTEKEMAAFS